VRIVFLGGKQAGVVGLLTTIACGHEVLAVVTIHDMVREIAERFGIETYPSYRDLPYLDADLMISVHSREILPGEVLLSTKLGGINVHPCLYKYKGIRPVPRMLKDGETKASIGVHWMIEEVDEGPVIVEKFQTVKGRTPEEVYNELYPLYSIALMEAFDRII